MQVSGYNNRIRRIAMLRALKLSRLTLIILLVLVCILFTVQKRSTSAPLAICLTCAFLPACLRMLTKKKASETDTEPLPMLSKKYSYSDNNFKCQLFSFITCVILLITWTYASRKTFIYGYETIPAICTGIYSMVYLVITPEESLRIKKLLLEGKI